MSARPPTVTIAVILLALLSFANLLAWLGFLPGFLPVSVILAHHLCVLGILGLAAAVGLWMFKRWGLWLTIVVSVLNILWPGLGLVYLEGIDPFQTLASQRGLAMGVVGFALVIVLAVLPSFVSAEGDEAAMYQPRWLPLALTLLTAVAVLVPVMVHAAELRAPAGFVACDTDGYPLGKAGDYSCPAPGLVTPKENIVYCRGASREDVDFGDCYEAG